MADEWAKDERGNIIVCPLVGYEAAIAFGTGIAVRLEFVDQPVEPGSPILAVQLAMTPAQAEEFGRVLLQTAERIVRMSSAERPEKPS